MSILSNPKPLQKVTSNQAHQKLYGDIQGNILKSHARKNVILLFLEFGNNPEPIKEWIRNTISNRVTSMSNQLLNSLKFKNQRDHIDPGFLSFSLSAQGYKKLGLNSGLKDSSFLNGMKSGTISADPDPGEWDPTFQEDVDAVIIIAKDPTDTTRILAQEVIESFPAAVRLIGKEHGKALKQEKEHFGFADGISQPIYFEDDLNDELRGNSSFNNWNPFAALNLVLTKDSLGKAFIDDGKPTDQGNHSYGSYLVFRKLEQDVQGWNKAVVEVAKKTKISPGLVGAYAVGRFQDGTPVVSHSSSQGAMPIENDFDFSNDVNGSKCPFHSHIRKTNPRGESPGGLDFDKDKVRITRRGIPYGDPEIQSEAKGLLFMCYQSNIKDQFDFMQNSWADNDNFLNQSTGIDSVIGQGSSSAKQWPSVHGQASFQQMSFQQFVNMKGGEYFFTPSISSLKNL